MITTEQAFNETINLERALNIASRYSSNYIISEKDLMELFKSNIDYDSKSFQLLNIIFVLKKHNDYLINILHENNNITK